jgi:hypothetical protein
MAYINKPILGLPRHKEHLTRTSAATKSEVVLCAFFCVGISSRRRYYASGRCVVVACFQTCSFLCWAWLLLLCIPHVNSSCLSRCNMQSIALHTSAYLDSPLSTPKWCRCRSGGGIINTACMCRHTVYGDSVATQFCTNTYTRSPRKFFRARQPTSVCPELRILQRFW